MENILKFFLNALKAIVLSPLYLIAFAFYLVICFINFIIGTFRTLFSGFKFGTKNENKYRQMLLERARQMKENEELASASVGGNE